MMKASWYSKKQRVTKDFDRTLMSPFANAVFVTTGKSIKHCAPSIKYSHRLNPYDKNNGRYCPSIAYLPLDFIIPAPWKSAIIGVISVFIYLPLNAHADIAQSLLVRSADLARMAQYKEAETLLAGRLPELCDNTEVVGNAIIYAYLAGDYPQVQEIFDQLSLARVPPYARMDLVQSLRSLGAYRKAIIVLQQAPGFHSIDGQLLYAALLAESHSVQQALHELHTMKHKYIYSVPQLNMLAYIYRKLDKPLHALQYSTRAWHASAERNHSSFREIVFSLEDAHAFSQALNLALQHSLYFSNKRMKTFRYNENSEAINMANSFKEHLEGHGFLFGKNLMLRLALANNKNNDNTFHDHRHLLLLSYYNEWVALRDIGDLLEVIRLYHEEQKSFLNLKNLSTIPNYALEPLADAYLHAHRPARAIAIYNHIIATSKYPSLNTVIGLYYAYISAEEYNKANTLLQKTANLTPPWRWAEAPATYRKSNWAWLRVNLLLAMNMAYRNHLMDALARLEKLHREAPENVGITNDLVTVQRWAGFFDEARRTLRSAAQLRPYSVGTLQNTAELAHEYRHANKWGWSISLLHRAFPFSNSITRHYQGYRRRQMPRISASVFFGHSTGAGSLPLGNQATHADYRVQSGWLYSNYTVFAGQHYSYSQFNHGSVSLNRSEFGVEWQRNRNLIELALTQKQLTGRQLGINLRAAHWFNDQWYLSLHFDSFTNDIPLRAYRAGLSGKRLSTTLEWRQSPDFKTVWNDSVMFISDGNTRIDNLISVDQSLWHAPHQILRERVSLWNENNTEHAFTYFNPRDWGDLEGGLHYEWITWRHYGDAFTQVLNASGGVGWQTGFGTAPAFDVHYLQRWTINRLWKIEYGVGFTGENYDGSYGQTAYTMARLRGTF